MHENRVGSSRFHELVIDRVSRELRSQGVSIALLTHADPGVRIDHRCVLHGLARVVFDKHLRADSQRFFTRDLEHLVRGR